MGPSDRREGSPVRPPRARRIRSTQSAPYRVSISGPHRLLRLPAGLRPRRRPRDGVLPPPPGLRRGRRALDGSSSATIRPHCGDAPFGAYLEIAMKKKTKKLVLSKETVRDLNFGN